MKTGFWRLLTDTVAAANRGVEKSGEMKIFFKKINRRTDSYCYIYCKLI